MEKSKIDTLKDLVKLMENLETLEKEAEKDENVVDMKEAQVLMDMELATNKNDAVEALKSMFNTIDISWELTNTLFGSMMEDKNAKIAAFLGTVGVKVMECTSAVYNNKNAKNTESVLNYAMNYLQDKIKKELK